MGKEGDVGRVVDRGDEGGIGIVFDVVMKESGYGRVGDMEEYEFGGLYVCGEEVKKWVGEGWREWKGGGGERWDRFKD